jgi:hypothetical protein
MGKVAGRTAADAPRLQAGSTAQDLLNTIGKYIPTDVTTAYVALAGSMALAATQPTADVKLKIAIVVAIAAAFAELVIATRTARDLKPTIGLLAVVVGSWFELVAAPIAFLVWSAAMPSSWFDWGTMESYMPALVVTLTSMVIGGLAVLLKRST